MKGTPIGTFIFIALAWLAIAPPAAFAQSAIAGVVKDTTGGVLPGVTVEASSPALIEKVRTVVTDDQGQYKIIDLRPGVYSVTFTLPGFSTVKREGIELPANFTAPVSGEMKVGTLEETVTVSSQSPLVDVQSSVQQQILPQQLLDALPTGGRNIQSVGAILPGIKQSAPDVGGAQGMQQTYMATHGADPRDNSIQIDGMSVNGIEGNGAIQNYFNEGMFAEMSYQTGGVSAETSGSGVRLNMIPKDGGNVFKSDLFFSISNHNLQADNLTPELQARGLKAVDSVDSIHDFNPALGGPIMRNRLWFFTSFRHWGVDQNVANAFYSLDPTHKSYAPDFSKQVIDNNLIKSGVLRLTAGAQKHKVSAYLDRIIKFRGHEGASLRSEEAFSVRNPKIYYTAQAKYTGTWSNKLLFEAGLSTNNESYTTGEWEPSAQATGNPIPRQDIIRGTAWSTVPGSYFMHEPIRKNVVTALSYVTGSHAFKTGLQWGYGHNRSQKRFQPAGPNPGFSVDLIQRYRNGVPDSVAVHNDPVEGRENLNADLGLYAQDTWTLKRLTMTPGVRFEHFNSSIAAQAVGPGRFVPARQFPEVPDLPNWNDVAPRVGVAYDLFGDASTALKGSIGRYMLAYSTTGFAQIYNPMFEALDIRTWRDLNGDDIAQDNEIGPSQNKSFGLLATRAPDPNVKRPYNIEYNASVQRQLAGGVSVTVGYFRREYYRSIWSDNLAAQPSDYSPIVITNPVDGTPLTVWSLDPAKLGAVNIVDKNSSTNTRVFNGVEVGFTARVFGGNFFGGTSIDRQVSNTCQAYAPQTSSNTTPSTLASQTGSNPNTFRYCDQSQYHIPFRTQFKLAGTYPLPLGLQLSGTLQSYPGTIGNGSGTTERSWLNVNYLVNSTIARGLTQSQETIPLVPPGSKYLDRWTQVDLRVAKKFRFRRVEWQAQVDLFNALNSNVVVDQLQTFGPSLDQPLKVLQGRMVSFGTQLHF